MEKPTCAVGGCGKPVKNRGWCSAHYERWRTTGDVQAHIPLVVRSRPYASEARCAVDGCERHPDCRGWCDMHYDRWRRTGDPLCVKVIFGDDRARFESYIDRSGGTEVCHPWTGGRHPEGYGWVKVGETQKLAHMAVWELENGPKPEGAQLDHECHNRAVRAQTCRPGKCPHRLCCNLAHIILRQSKREHFDATVPWDRGAWARSNAKLTETQVREIRELLKDGGMISRRFDLAERYGVTTMTIYRIATGSAWPNVGTY